MTTLTNEQRAAVESPHPRRLVCAGAGSGKTRTLVAAVLHEFGRGEPPIQPSQVLVITYTNAAADEMRKRIDSESDLSITEGSIKLGWCGTFHGFLYRLLRTHGAAVGLSERLVVVDDDYKVAALETIMQEMGVKLPVGKVLPHLKENYVRVPNINYSKEQLAALEYHGRMRSEGLLDFDSVLHYGHRLVTALGARGEWPYKSVYVDEAQDSSDEDWAIYGAMACERKFICGDPDQSIYQFRGSAVGNFVRVAELGQNPKATGSNVCEVHLLEDNYRCETLIAQAAQRLIEHNPNRVAKETRAVKDGGSVACYRLDSPAAEMNFVLGEIQSYRTSGGRRLAPFSLPEDYRDCAVLARTNRLCREFAAFLKANGVPVAEKVRKEQPMDWARTKALLAALANPWSDFAVLQYIASNPDPRGKQLAADAKRNAAKAMVTVNQVVGHLFGSGDPINEADLRKHGVSDESCARVLKASGECFWLKGFNPVPTSEILAQIAATEYDAEDVGEGVTVCTIHAAKGREWRTVFVVGCEEGTLPSGKKGTDVCEERRLAYVAFTRAEERLVCTWCAARPQYRGENVPCGPLEAKQPSRFLIESGLLTEL